MYKLADINFSDYNILPSLAVGSNIALAGFLDMPKRLGKTHHVWQEDNVEPYVSASEIHFGGRDITFKGLLNLGTRESLVTNLNAFYEQINQLTDLEWLLTPYGNFKVYLKEEIAVKYYDFGVADITIKFRQPNVPVPINFVAPLFVSSDFIDTVCNPIIDNYDALRQSVFNNFVTTSFIGEGFIEQLLLPTREHHNLDGFQLDSLGLFVKKVADNYNRPVAQEAIFIEDNLTEQYQIKSPGLKKLRVQLIALAPSVKALSQNTNALFVMLSKPNLHKIQIDNRFLDVFAIDGFEVKNIGNYNSTSVAEIELELIII